MTIEVWIFIHTKMATVTEVQIFHSENDAQRHMGTFLKAMKPIDWNDEQEWNAGAYNDYRRDSDKDASVSLRHKKLTVPNKNNPALYTHEKFIRGYASRYSLDLPCLEGVALERLDAEDLVAVLDNACNIMLCQSNIDKIRG